MYGKELMDEPSMLFGYIADPMEILSCNHSSAIRESYIAVMDNFVLIISEFP